jgi:hypothetical protein
VSEGCGACKTQKDLFGPAAERLNLVYCYATSPGIEAQGDLCRDKRISGVPTWEIDGKRAVGVRSLEQLAELSGFEFNP